MLLIHLLFDVTGPSPLQGGREGGRGLWSCDSQINNVHIGKCTKDSDTHTNSMQSTVLHVQIEITCYMYMYVHRGMHRLLLYLHMHIVMSG